MKRFLALLLALVCLLIPAMGSASSLQGMSITLPEDSTVFDADFALKAIALNQLSPQLLGMMGLTPILQAHYDKDPLDAAHTSAYTVCQASVPYKGVERTLLVVLIRATEGGEWYSNFDCAPSQDNETQYAENFYAAAQDIYTGIQPVLAQAEAPLVVVTGYSRGAACANLLGMLLNPVCGVENVFVYTAATPNTVRGEAAKTECPNVFNIINPCDMITALPPSAWGYTRLGTDIVLPGDEAIAAQLAATMAHFAVIAPDIVSYYTVRHSLTGPGESPVGLTAYEVMLRLVDQLMGKMDATTTAVLQMLSPESDFAPLLEVFLTSADDPASLMNQHSPLTYQALFGQYQQSP